jgi:hypothetical protein
VCTLKLGLTVTNKREKLNPREKETGKGKNSPRF